MIFLSTTNIFLHCIYNIQYTIVYELYIINYMLHRNKYLPVVALPIINQIFKYLNRCFQINIEGFIFLTEEISLILV